MATTSQGRSVPVRPSVSDAPAVDATAADLSATEQRLGAFAKEEASDQRRFRRAIAVASLFHLGLLAITFPSFTSEAPTEPDRPKVYVVETVRFKAPPPKQQQVIPKRRARKVPMPDPTPRDPEPVTLVAPEPFDDLPIDTIDITIPVAPPEPDTGPRFVTPDVKKPEKMVFPAPRYTEIARKTRIQGTVIVQSTIDEQGNVIDAKVLKGLPMGLSEAAVDAVLQWKFRPATLKGKPVSVYFNLTVTFSLS